jgi:hypothetical protein
LTKASASIPSASASAITWSTTAAEASLNSSTSPGERAITSLPSVAANSASASSATPSQAAFELGGLPPGFEHGLLLFLGQITKAVAVHDQEKR